MEIGAYLPGEALGAYQNGTRIVKVRMEEGDRTVLGTGGKVISSHYVGDVPVPEVPEHVEYFYFVVWDDFPHPVGIMDYKIGMEVPQ